jgi:hypothetical protein
VTGLVVTVTHPDMGDATGPIVTVTVTSLQVRTVLRLGESAVVLDQLKLEVSAACPILCKLE